MTIGSITIVGERLVVRNADTKAKIDPWWVGGRLWLVYVIDFSVSVECAVVVVVCRRCLLSTSMLQCGV